MTFCPFLTHSHPLHPASHINNNYIQRTTTTDFCVHRTQVVTILNMQNTNNSKYVIIRNAAPAPPYEFFSETGINNNVEQKSVTMTRKEGSRDFFGSYCSSIKD